MGESKKFNESIVREVRLRRIQLGLTQAEIAKKVDMSPTIYGHIESGRRELKIIEFYKLCKFLELPLTETLNDCSLKLLHGTEYSPNGNYKGKVVAFTSFKGGAGVSTLSILYCNKISNQFKVLLIDATDQLSCFHMRENDDEFFQESKAQYEIKAVEVDKLAIYLDTVRSEYDYIIIDLPRIFYFKDEQEPVCKRCNHIFAPFYLKLFYLEKNEEDEYLRAVDGRLDLFIELKERIKKLNEETIFSLISFENEIPLEFKEWIEGYDIGLIPQAFKRHSELQSHIDTYTDITKNEDISYAPFIEDTQKLLYYLERETDSNLYIEDQNQMRKQRIEKYIKKVQEE